MPLNPTLLGNEIKSAIDSLGGSTNRDEIFKKLAEAIVTHLQTNGVVTTIVTSGSSAGTYQGKIL